LGSHDYFNAVNLLGFAHLGFQVTFTYCVHFIFRVFTFGIGSGASTALVNGLAKAGKGTSEFIKEGERMQPKASIKLYDS